MTQEKIQIKVNIANRLYPLTINEKEEEGVRKAEKLINNKMKEYEKNFAVNDKLDLLSMTALHFVTELIRKEEGLQNETQREQEVISDIDLQLGDYLHSINVL